MKKSLMVIAALILCAGLGGCVTLQSSDTDPTANAAGTTAPVSEPQGGETAPPGTTAEANPPTTAQDGPLAGLAAHYPWERLPLPEGSEFVKVENIEDGEKYIEYTYVLLPMTKTQAVAYFKPLMEKDADLFVLDDALPYVPIEVQGSYPDAAQFASLYSRYTADTEPNINVITVNLYTLADGETMKVAVVQVNYDAKP